MKKTKELPPPPYANVYAKAIALDDALEDSPMFRKRLRDSEAEVEEFAIGVKKIIKVSKQHQAAAMAYAESLKEFMREVNAFKGTMACNDEALDSGFSHFTNGLSEIASYQEFLGSQMEGLLSAPLNDFVNNDVKLVKESYKKYEKSTNLLDSVVSKLGQVKKKNSDKVAELSESVEDAKKTHRATVLELTLRINEVLAKKKFEFLEYICVYIQSQSTFFHQGYQFFTDNEPKIKNYSHYLQSTRQNFEEETAQYEKQKSLLLDESPQSPIMRKEMQGGGDISAGTMRGYIFKRSDDVININTWNRRYFVLKDGTLCYYKTGKEEQPDMSLALLLCSVKMRPDLDRRNCFEIVSPPDRSLILQAENDELMNQWIQAIQASISNSLNSQPSPAAERKKSEATTAVTQESSPLTKLREKSQGNCVCADCDSPLPDWASFNLGVLLCIDCSGVHRSLGVHISKVRSLSLDQWEPDLLDLMLGLGNEFVNSVYECNIPSDRTKPTAADSREAKNKWIRDKYEKKLFMKKYIPQSENADDSTIKFEMATALCAATKENDIKKVFELILQGADVSFQNPEGELRSAVHEAISVNNASILLLLLMHNATPHLMDSNGWSPLHLASDLGQANCAVLLLQKNAINSLSSADTDGKTPLDLAIARGSADCVTLLRLAQLARDEGAQAFEESFADALRQFSRDTRANKD